MSTTSLRCKPPAGAPGPRGREPSGGPFVSPSRERVPTPNEIDRTTLARARRGDRRALEAFLRRYVGPLHALVRRSGFGPESEDLTQDLLAKLLRALPEFDPEGPGTLSTWVFA